MSEDEVLAKKLRAYRYKKGLSQEELAKQIGVSKETIRSWIRKETIPYHKVGRQYKFKASEVDKWVESGESANADKQTETEE